MNLLITGGAGFIGSNFVRYWLENHSDSKVINLDKLTYAGNLENLSDVEDNSNYSFVRGDICDGELVTKTIKENKIDTIVHFAAETHVDRSLLGAKEFLKTNIEGTYTLLEAARDLDVKRFHHISTDEVFGAIGEGEDWKFTEETPYKPRNPYSASKAASDHQVRAFYESFGLPITITNCSNNYGPYLFPEKLISLAITNLIEGKKVPIYGQGLQSRDWLYVTDHCKAIELVLQKGKIGETYCVGGMHTEVTNKEVVQKLCDIMGKDFDKNTEYVADRLGHDFKYVVDFSKIENELGWSPTVELDEGLEQTVKWYQDNSDWWKRVKNKEYQNYYDKQYGGRAA
ncbi:MAG: dTDP-glucose 4,6-dehydratase [Bdellovibrionota bacterium]